MLRSINNSKKELFKDWYKWSIHFKDCDPAIWMANYIFKRFEFNKEQRYWLIWLYGNTYNYPTAFILWNEFPDYELVTVDRLTKWNNENYKRLRYQVDTKYNKGHLPAMYESYYTIMGYHTQSKVFDFYTCYDEKKNFDELWNLFTKKQYKFGRYTTWFYLQALKHCCNVPIETSSLMLRDYEGSRSHRNGLVLALGLNDWVDTKLTENEYNWLEGVAGNLLHEMKQEMPEHKNDIDLFTMETCLCSFKKIFRERNGRYLGYYLDRQSEEINQVEHDGWYGIDWNVLWQARKETLDKKLSMRSKIDKSKMSYYLKTGSFERLDWLKETNKIGLENFF